jgi:hypothetical protein
MGCELEQKNVNRRERGGSQRNAEIRGISGKRIFSGRKIYWQKDERGALLCLDRASK